MKHINDYVIYKKDVCKIVEIKKNHINNNDYYILQSVFNDSLKIEIPTDNNKCKLRYLLTKKEVNKLINEIPKIETLEEDDFIVEKKYKDLIDNGTHKDLIKIIKTIYKKMKENEKNNKKIGDREKNYYNLAEKYLYEEFSIVLGKSFQETKKYITDILNSML